MRYGIQLHEGMKVYWPDSQYVEELSFRDVPMGSFTLRNDLVYWKTVTGEMYMERYSLELIRYLLDHSLKHTYFEVPFIRSENLPPVLAKEF